MVHVLSVIEGAVILAEVGYLITEIFRYPPSLVGDEGGNVVLHIG
jgi:hypothetical protein